MIGFIIYELVDVGVSLTKLLGGGVYSAYRWYYGIPTEQDNISNQLKYLKDEIKSLEEKIDKYEKSSDDEKSEGNEGKPISA